jgi:hypothetical protein
MNKEVRIMYDSLTCISRVIDGGRAIGCLSTGGGWVVNHTEEG